MARGIGAALDQSRRTSGLNITENKAVHSEIVVFYPSGSLEEQVGAWAERHPECGVASSFVRSLTGIRQTLRNADLALLDATVDAARTMPAFAQAVAKLGAGRVAMYTETMHAWLELAVRIRGVLLLFGPLSGQQWDDFFGKMLPADRRLYSAGFVMPRPDGLASSRGETGPREHPGKRSPAGFRRPKTGVR
jgi:hypothetical protein